MEDRQILNVVINVRIEGDYVIRQAVVNGEVTYDEKIWVKAYYANARPHQFMDDVEQFFNPRL